jgi:hypothetical protein
LATDNNKKKKKKDTGKGGFGGGGGGLRRKGGRGSGKEHRRQMSCVCCFGVYFKICFKLSAQEMVQDQDRVKVTLIMIQACWK